MTEAKKGTVYLVGAGPGDPELLTVRALQLLKSADVIYHDDLVSREILELAHARAVVVSVGKRAGTKHITQDEINAKIITNAQQGLSVVRLKSGDPMIFGRAGEEISALTEARVPYGIVPGITAAVAAAAALGCSLTDRRAASSILFMTGHHADDLNPSLPPTRVVYMPGSDLSIYAAAWLADGEAPEMPCAIISRVSQPEQCVMRTSLGDLAQMKVPAAPSLLIAGWALQERGLETELKRILENAAAQ